MTESLEPARADRRPWMVLGGAAVLLTLTWFAYLPALHGGPIWDDGIILTHSRVMTGPHQLQRIWFNPRESPDYFPLTQTAFWAMKQFFGIANLTGYHAVNVALHGLNALLVWRLMNGLRLRGGYFAAALFAVHPVMLESVAWVSELKNTLSGTFAILMAISFAAAPTRRSTAATVAFFVLAIFSKFAVVGLPVVMLAIAWWKHRRLRRSQVIALAAMFVIAAGMAGFALWTQSNVVLAKGIEFGSTTIQKLSLPGPIVAFYVKILLVPVRLRFLYSLWALPRALGWQHLLTAALPVVLVALYILRKWIGRGPLTAAVIVLAMLGPVLGPLTFYSQRYTFVANHLTYLACIAVFASVAWAAFSNRRAGHLIAFGSIAFCAAQTWSGSHAYVNNDAVFQDVVAKEPGNWEANAQLGAALLSRGRYAEAAPYFERALKTYPLGGECWVGLGEVAEHDRRYTDALDFYRRGVQCRPMSPISHYNYANMLLVSARDVRAAISEYRISLSLDPDRAAAHDNLGYALQHIGAVAEARDEFETALRLDPTLAIAKKHLRSLTP